VEKKPSSSSRIVGLATRSDREGDAKKLLAKSSNKKLITDPTSCQAADTRVSFSVSVSVCDISVFLH
jgi:hypothetical protein